MNTKFCPKCKSKIALVSGIAVMNPIGKSNSKGQFIPASMCHDGETVYPVHSQITMISVDKCPACGYSQAEM